MKTSSEIRKHIYNHIILAGENTLFENFQKRIMILDLNFFVFFLIGYIFILLFNKNYFINLVFFPNCFFIKLKYNIHGTWNGVFNFNEKMYFCIKKK